MLHYGKIQTYDVAKGSGTIAPENGGQMVEFGRADLHRNAAEPKTGQRFGYQVSQIGDTNPRATKLELQHVSGDSSVKGH